MRLVAIDVCVTVCLSVCVTVGHNREPCKKVQPIEMLFGLWTRVGPVTWGPGSPQGKEQFLGLFCPSEMHCNSKSAENGDILSVQYTGWAKKLGPQTHDHNSVKSERI